MRLRGPTPGACSQMQRPMRRYMYALKSVCCILFLSKKGLQRA